MRRTTFGDWWLISPIEADLTILYYMRSIVCDVLMKRPDENNWSPYPNVDFEERRAFSIRASGLKVYDVIEAAVYSSMESRSEDPLSTSSTSPDEARFAEQINEFFRRKGIGWQLANGRVEIRGPEAFEATVRPVVGRLAGAGMTTAANEIHEALNDLARRPKPDITGAMQHSMAAAECVLEL